MLGMCGGRGCGFELGRGCIFLMVKGRAGDEIRISSDHEERKGQTDRL